MNFGVVFLMVGKSVVLSLVFLGCKSKVFVSVVLGLVKGKSCVVVEVEFSKKVDRWVGLGIDIFDD